MPTHLIWFRQDLRITDNSALWHATQPQHPCIALVVLSPQQWQIHQDAHCKINFYLRQLKSLQQQLLTLNIPLIIKTIQHYQDIAPYLDTLTDQLSISQLYANTEYAVNERQRDQDVQQRFNQKNKKFHQFEDRTLFPSGSIRTQSNAPYKIFTPFKKACYQRLQHAIPQCFPSIIALPHKPTLPPNLCTIDIDEQLKKYPVSSQVLKKWPIGESIAQRQLYDFVDTEIQHYQQQRDFPAIAATSHLSAYLNIGILSVRQCLQAIFQQHNGAFIINNMGVETWLNELLWREFYQHIMLDFPKVSRSQPFKEETRHIKWRDAEADFERWTQGKTGIPIVDAGMRELQQSGWMHNRVRMVCAMFLTKNLLIDWRKGERWFIQHLIDGDLAANNGGWQWAASTGTDAVPYFRIFNPVTQSKRFDAEGKYIKTWLPELSALPSTHIHAPFEHQLSQTIDYPQPMVDLKSSRLRAIEAFKAV